MNLARTALLALITVIGFSSVTANAQSFASSKKTRSMDEQVYSKLRYVSDQSVFDFIDYQINGGTVTLSGKVVSLGAKSRAARVVRDVPGVTNVVNNIEMVQPSPSDNAIRSQALREFTSRGPAQYFSEIGSPVHIIVERGRITLEGYVARRSDSDLLTILASGIPGVFSVTNNVVVGERKF